MISPAPDSAIITPTPSPEMISPAPDSANIQLVPNLNEEVLPKKLTPTPPKNEQTVETQQLPNINDVPTMSIPGQNPQTLPNTNSFANTAQQDVNSMVQSQQ